VRAACGVRAAFFDVDKLAPDMVFSQDFHSNQNKKYHKFIHRGMWIKISTCPVDNVYKLKKA
jgi:hypothetical protein